MIKILRPALILACIAWLVTIVNTQQVLTITPSSASIDVGETVTFSASKAGVAWASSDPTIASVVPSGDKAIVTGEAVGVAVISAKYKQYRGEAKVSVTTTTPAVLDVTCPATVSRVSPDGNSVSVSYAATVTGGVSPSLAYSPTSPHSFAINTTTSVLVTASSTDGQTGSCSFPVTITYTAPPSGTIPTTPDVSWIQIDPSSGSSQYIQAVVDGHVGATTFWLKAGTHVQQTVYPKSGNTFIGAIGAIMDGQALKQYAFYSNNLAQTNVTIQRIEIKNYKTTAMWYGPIAGDNVTNWVVTDSLIHNNEQSGIRVGPGTGWQILRNVIYNNSKAGISGYKCHGAIIKDNEVYGNNASQTYLPSSSAGEAGVKIFGSSNVLIENNNVHNNFGKGIWSDTNYPTMRITDNTVSNNRDFGIWHEIGFAAVITGNTVTGNGFTATSGSLNRAGIGVTNSPNVEITGNIVTDNYMGISLMYWYSATGGYPLSDPTYGSYETKNAYVHDNTIQMHVGKTGMETTGDQSFYTGWNNRWVHNAYELPSTTGQFFQFSDAWKTFAEWQASGRDTTGSVTAVP
jgi:parallel beta-helix repeat protein